MFWAVESGFGNSISCKDLMIWKEQKVYQCKKIKLICIAHDYLANNAESIAKMVFFPRKIFTKKNTRTLVQLIFLTYSYFGTLIYIPYVRCLGLELHIFFFYLTSSVEMKSECRKLIKIIWIMLSSFWNTYTNSSSFMCTYLDRCTFTVYFWSFNCKPKKI